MKKIVLVLSLLISVVYAQYLPTSAKTAFKNGLSLGTKDTTAFSAVDSLVITIDRNGRLIYRHINGSWKVLAWSNEGAVSSVFGRTGAVIAQAGDYGGYYPSLTGTGASGTWGVNITGNSATVTNGVYTNGSYANPSWITSLDWGKVTGTPTTLSGYGITDAQGLIAAGTTAQYWRGDKTFQTLNTTAVAEGTNLYYTEARVSNNTNVLANTAARHNAVTIGTANGLSLSTQVLSMGLSSTSTTGALSSTDWNIFNNKLSANQTITLSGDVTGSGTTSIVTAIGANKVTNAMLLGSIDYAKMNAATVPTWNQNTTGNAATVTNGVYSTTLVSGRVPYANGSNTLTTSTGLLFDGTTLTATGLTASTTATLPFATAVAAGDVSSVSGHQILLNADANQIVKKISSANFISSMGLATSSQLGSYLPLSGGTLTGALSGTSAAFSGATQLATSSGNVLIKTTTDNGVDALQVNGSIKTSAGGYSLKINSGTTSYVGGHFLNASGGVYIAAEGSSGGQVIIGTSPYSASSASISGLNFSANNGGINHLNISSTGAATFSSSVTAGSFDVANGNYFRAQRSSGGVYLNTLGYISGTNDLLLSFSDILRVRSTGVTDLMTLSSTGAATFSSSVTATGFFESSDTTLKNIFHRYTPTNGVGAIKYTWKKGNDGIHFGYAAQDVQRVNPSMVGKNTDGTLTVNYTEVHTMKIQALEERIKKLESIIETLIKQK